jgi:hypothetical protein
MVRSGVSTASEGIRKFYEGTPGGRNLVAFAGQPAHVDALFNH